MIVAKFADCPHYSYGNNTIEPTCTKNFCYDIGSCDHKNMVRYKQALDEIENLCKNEACVPCKELEEDNHCDEFRNKIILDIIEATRGEIIKTELANFLKRSTENT